jgi:hypothetical protein
MPVLTSSDRLAPKSILRHRPIDPAFNAVEPPRVPRASRTQTHKPSPAITVPIEVPVWKHSGKSQAHWRHHLLMIGVGVGMAFAVLLVFVGQFLLGWLGTTMDDLHYGRPRTYQVDAIVGQNDGVTHPSHFIALNFKGQIEVIEFPAGDATHAKIYLGPHLYGSGADLVPVTLQFIDSRHDHQPDMIVQVQGEQIIFHNTQGSFHAPPANSQT